MMKKLMVLSLVLAIGAVSSAALSLVADGSTVIVNSDVARPVDFWVASDIQYTGFELADIAKPTADSFVTDWGLDVGQYWLQARVASLNPDNPIIAGGWLSISFADVVGWGDQDMGLGAIYLWDGDLDGVIATLYAIPEPMTMGLLGLGALFLRRRK